MRAEDGEKETWRRLADGELSWKALRARARVLEGIRAFFRGRGFLEVDPPIAQAYPNLDPNVFPVKISDAAGNAARFYLHTSPELAMKKLLAAGSGDIFFLGKVFRDREGSPLHSPEFTMLEWYRAGRPAESVMRDVEELVRSLSRTIAGEAAVRRGGSEIPLDGPWPRWELDDAFRELLGVGMADERGLREALTGRGFRPGADESWEDLFFRACLDVVEPALAARGACFLTGYPAALGAMARRRPGRPEVSERFEGFVAGVELVNGYEELTDPAEQAERLLVLADRHRRSTGETLSVDPGFLDALRLGLPPCAGAALGVDRLVMLLLGKEDIADGMYR
ncbi:MAG TPA: EF-P lysine aminoacylase EpmA [Candidatus Deferrimicrobiaceae bacterium]|nr:EF-P lysine aminoacylase EpmA [Candidatus Deferrimicrobiaceae bacterium]